MSDDLMREFRAYRDAAMASTTSRLDHPTFSDRRQLLDLLAAEWPEAARVAEVAPSSLLSREVGHGHQDGALVELTYQLGSDELGWRRFCLTWVDEEVGWRWEVAADWNPVIPPATARS